MAIVPTDAHLKKVPQTCCMRNVVHAKSCSEPSSGLWQHSGGLLIQIYYTESGLRSVEEAKQKDQWVD